MNATTDDTTTNATMDVTTDDDTTAATMDTIPFEAADLGARLCTSFRTYGVAIITGVFAPNECDQLMDEIVGSFEKLCPELDRAAPATWTRNRCPPQTRVGLYQCVVANLQPLWRIR